MDVTDQDEIKFSAYTLFCHHLLRLMKGLKRALRAANYPTTRSALIKKFDSHLEEDFFKKDYSDIPDAVDYLAGWFKWHASTFNKTPQIQRVLEDVAASAVAVKKTWTYQRGIEICHRQGRKLATIFFENTAWPETRRRLAIKASVHCYYGNPELRALFSVLTEGGTTRQIQKRIEILITKMEARILGQLHVHSAQMFTFPDEEENAYTITLPFEINNCTFMLYASYPYLFMHEYTAHIFSTDYENDFFNDPWMMNAASEFLLTNCAKDKRLSFLKAEQSHSFDWFLRDKLQGRALEESQMAADIIEWLRRRHQPWIQTISHELAGFVAGTSDNKAWPSRVLRTLSGAVANPDRLKELETKMQTVSSLEELYPHLKLK